MFKNLKLKKLDIFFVLFFVTLSILLIVRSSYRFMGNGTGEKKLILVHGAFSSKIRLSFEDNEYDFNKPFYDYSGGGRTLHSEDDLYMTVKDGEVNVISSSCRDQICVKTQTAKNCGDQIICLPNYFMVMIDCGE